MLKIEMIGIAGNYILVKTLIRSHAEEQYCLHPEAGRLLFSDETRKHNDLMVNNPLLNSITMIFVIHIYRKTVLM